MNYKKFVKKQDKIFVSGFERVSNYRKQWDDFEERVNSEYEPLIKELKDNFRFDFFYLKKRSDFTNSDKRTNQEFIQFYMGNHMLGIKQDEKDQLTGKHSSKLVSESGGALLFTQGPQGEVLVLIYPCDSEVLKFNDKHITYKIYAYPCKITRKELQKIIRFYFRFVYMTSFVGRIRLTDRLRLGWIKFRVGFDILKFGKSVFGVSKKALEIVSGVSGISGNN